MADVETLERFDHFSGLRNGLRLIAEMKDEWAGIPMPLEGIPLVVEPKYPKAQELMAIGRQPPKEPEQGIKIRSKFWSAHRRGEVIIFDVHGKLEWGIHFHAHHLDLDLQTLGASCAWGIEQESNALQLLATLIRHHQFKQYLLTGMFIEQSPRSHISYIFRRLKPTVAVSKQNESLKILCCLCSHPLGFYEGSWAGVMTPTDDVISALMLMRGDEKRFWKRANQHPAYRPEAGL